ncbi:MAG: hypothetical protein KGL95_08225, partial [Patescibacteria group bacterium]|nr:hypothetical protein [Patescibacteria group bacterium]
HALGMEHVKNTDAIMYAQTNDNLTPTIDDLAELQRVCKKQTAMDRIAGWIATIKQKMQSQ